MTPSISLLTHLQALRFRNLEPLDWRPGAGRHLLFGDNGAGKTSVLEAIYALATTKSFRTPRLIECVRHGGEGFHLEAEVEGERRVGVVLGWRHGEGRYRSVNGKATPLAEHLGVLAAVAWTSREVEILHGPPALRRRFLDRGVVHLRPAAVEVIARYRQTLAHKRELLVQGRSRAEVAPWNELLAVAAAEMVTLRSDYARRLQAALGEVLSRAELPYPEISVTYRPSVREGLDGAPAVLAVLEAELERERAVGQVLRGPHRDDLRILWGGRPVHGVASAGEGKALSLLLAVAQGRVVCGGGRQPIYLLDDADAELAPGTLRKVWRGFEGAGQLFATSNRPRVWEDLGAESSWLLQAGSLCPR